MVPHHSRHGDEGTHFIFYVVPRVRGWCIYASHRKTGGIYSHAIGIQKQAGSR